MRGDGTAVLVDTSAWIEFYHGDEGPIGAAVARLIEADLAVLAAPVHMELLKGIRSARERRLLLEHSSVLTFLLPDGPCWERAGGLGALLAARGLSIPSLDLLIAQLALDHRLPVLTLDRHFGLIALHTTLQLARITPN